MSEYVHDMYVHTWYMGMSVYVYVYIYIHTRVVYGT